MTVEIGKRFKPEPALHIDTETGTFWARLPPVESSTEIATQRALRLPMPKSVQGRVAFIQKDRRRQAARAA
jgi:hypothetical protein